MHVRTILAAAALSGLCGAVYAANQTVNVGPSTAFNPAVVTITSGDTVTWNWLASGHSTTSDATTGPEVWNSGVLASGATFAHTFSTVGTFQYYCVIHGAPGGIGMSGQVIVAAPPTATPTIAPTPAVTPTPVRPAAIPDLGRAGRAVLALALAAAAILVLLFTRSR